MQSNFNKIKINGELFNIESVELWYEKLNPNDEKSVLDTLEFLLSKLREKINDKTNNKTNNKTNKLTSNEKKYITEYIKIVKNIMGYFEVSKSLNQINIDFINIFFSYLKDKTIHIPYLESWIYPEMKEWSYVKLYSTLQKSSEDKNYLYCAKCAIVLFEKAQIQSEHTEEAIAYLLKNNDKHELGMQLLKKILNINYMIIPEIIRPKTTTQCSFLAFDIIGFSNTENNDEIDMLDYFEDMLKQFRYEMGKIKGITPQDVAVLYVGDCLAISLKCNNHAEILFNFTKRISKQSQFDKYTFALHTGEAYWINFKEYEETPFKQLIHPEVNYLFRLIGKSKNENYIYISKKMYEALQNKPSFKQEQQSIISDEKEDNETIAQNIYYTQQIKHNYFVEYIKFKRR
ncbi:MAG: hypothetical protein EAZ44_00965 [Cytophagia bacterium]|nr:MAG: hypothetical protein EAZ44_00965 [Cytophagia bacterium]TAG44414.1 MAG: hypothetical protein EAZ31_02500 [Cytophagia bacterium]